MEKNKNWKILLRLLGDDKMTNMAEIVFLRRASEIHYLIIQQHKKSILIKYTIIVQVSLTEHSFTYYNNFLVNVTI